MAAGLDLTMMALWKFIDGEHVLYYNNCKGGLYLDELADAFGAVVAEKRLQSLHALGRQQLVPITGHRVHREKHLHATHFTNFTQTHNSTYLCASIHIA